MELKVLERLMVMAALPKEGNAVTLRLRQDLIKKVGLSAEEIDELGIKTNASGGVSWDVTKEKVVNLTLTDSEKALIVEALKQKDQNGTLLADQLGIYEKFVEGKGA